MANAVQTPQPTVDSAQTLLSMAIQKVTRPLTLFLAQAEEQAREGGPLVEFGFYIGTGVAAALVISILHAQVNQRFQTMVNNPLLPVALVVYLLLGPSLWILFAWQPRAIRGVLLSIQGIVADSGARELSE